MGVLGGPAGAVRSMVAMLQANLAGGIAAVWTNAGATIADGNMTLTVPQMLPQIIYTHEHHITTESSWVMVWAVEGDYLPIQEQSSNDMSYHLVIEWGICGDNIVVLQEQVARWQQAIFWTIQKHKQLDGLVPGIYNTTPGKSQLSKILPRGQVAVQVGQMPATVHAAEQVPF